MATFHGPPALPTGAWINKPGSKEAAH